MNKRNKHWKSKERKERNFLIPLLNELIRTVGEMKNEQKKLGVIGGKTPFIKGRRDILELQTKKIFCKSFSEVVFPKEINQLSWIACLGYCIKFAPESLKCLNVAELTNLLSGYQFHTELIKNNILCATNATYVQDLKYKESMLHMENITAYQQEIIQFHQANDFMKFHNGLVLPTHASCEIESDRQVQEQEQEQDTCEEKELVGQICVTYINPLRSYLCNGKKYEVISHNLTGEQCQKLGIMYPSSVIKFYDSDL